MKASRNIDTLLEIMARLRTPETGCPWDLEQDFSTIAPYTIEEAYEVADAITRNDMEDLRLELGDLLLQSVYHAQMAKEEGLFDFGDVVESISAKMIRRHPHVFGTADVSAEEFSANGMEEGTWERIKAEEKREQAERRAELGLPPKEEDTSILSSVPANLPALTEALKLQKNAAKSGFDWKDAKLVFQKLEEEAKELEEAVDAFSQDRIEEELGDLIFTIANLARHYRIDPEVALKRCNQKFRKRFTYVERQIAASGKSLEEATLDEMENHWQSSKSAGAEQAL